MIYVYTMPEKLSDGHCFNEGKPITFTNVDWFNSPSEMGQSMTEKDIMKFIASKTYARTPDRLMVVDTADNFTMLITFAPCDLCRNVMPYMEVCQACGRINRNQSDLP